MQIGRKRIAHRTRSHARSAFTLIELLVTITIIALLISLLAPALKEARLSARMLREQSALRSFMQTYVNYATSYKDSVIVPTVPWDWAHPRVPSTKFAGPPDLLNGPNNSGVVTGPSSPNTPTFASSRSQATSLRMPAPDPSAIIEGSCIKVWPLRFWGHMEYPSNQMQIDGATYKSFFERSKQPTARNTLNAGPSVQNVHTYDSGNNFLGALSYHPSWGLNSVFVGGSFYFGAYESANAVSLGSRTGNFYAKHTYDIRQSSKILVATSSRSYDLIGSGMGSAGYGGGAVPPGTSNVIIPGHHMVLPTKMFSTGSTGTSAGSGGGTPTPWNASDTFDPKAPPTSWGYIDFRWKGKSISGFIDGHVEPQTIRQLRDMRYWSDRATKADWIPTKN